MIRLHPTRRSIICAALILSLIGCSEKSPIEPPDDDESPPADLPPFFNGVPAWTQFSPVLADAEAPSGATSDPANVVIDGSPHTCTTTPYSLTTTPDQITTMNPDVEVLWVGALLQGDGYVQGIGSLAELPIRQRTPVELTIDLLTGGNSRVVQNPTVATVNQAIGQLISDAHNAGHRAGSNIFYTSETAHSLEQATLKMGLSAKYMGASIKTSLSAEMSDDKRTVTAYFVQRMFTTSMVLPQNPESVFSDAFTQAMLEREEAQGRMGPDNVPVYVSSVVYGRILMFSFTSTSSLTKINATLNAMYNDGEFGGELEGGLQEVLDNAQIRVVTVGGDANHALQLIRSNDLASYFSEDAPLTTARPISYTVRSLKDNVIARVSETTTYSLKQCSPVAAVATGATFEIQMTYLRADALPTIDWPPPATNLGDNANGAEVYYNFHLEAAGSRTPLVVWAPPVIGLQFHTYLQQGGSLNLVNRDGSAVDSFTINLHFDGRDRAVITGDVYDWDPAPNPHDRFSFRRELKWPDKQLPLNTTWSPGRITASDDDGNVFSVFFRYRKVGDLFD